ncbi:PAS domain-containing protein [Salinimicrobium tongyeongense]|uniref:PAS domain-containing protein n=1 Tax=Salinimicrobium tongyeongense TaxID=2809707 RepID=A0ABY6NQ37_9FLAO|nr:chemotaxis protein CheB [Salinimicrobium tongyeongense]UZH54894.1 PAS domain-containing protein [Salinimicrobium tongyeongense]
MSKKIKNSPTLQSETTTSPSNTRIVAIGASAGGLEALKAFFEHIPQGTKSAYVIIQHLSSDYKSMMGELLARSTGLPIREVTEGMEIMPGHIYLIPPANNLVVKNSRLHLLDKPKNPTLNLPIDMFFESLAREHREKAIGVILSGTGSDGTRGARAIKESDGMIMVQEPDEAQFDGMPRSAIGTGLVDYVLTVKEMGNELDNYLTAPSIFHFKDGDVAYDQSELIKILNFIDEKTGLDFREYKRSTLARRVARRVSVCKCRSLSEYYSYLTKTEGEVDILYREFLIGVTKFFRDSKVWEVIRKKVIPEMVSAKSDGDVIKLWDVACSTGEEAYSFAMCFIEEIESQGKNIELKIFATDIAEKHLEIGSKGLYPESIAADVPADFLAKYFTSKPHKYEVVEKLRRAVIFSRHNVIKNPPFSNMDLVSCRNLLIYFQPAIQTKALSVLHYSLKQDGVLVLGTSESVHTEQKNFSEIDRKWKIFRNIQPNNRLEAGLSHTPTSAGKVAGSKPAHKGMAYKAPANSNFNKLTVDFNETVLDHFKAASVYVDSDYNILEAIGEFRKYANLPVSGFSTNLLDMLGTDLRYLIQNSLKRAGKLQQKVYYKDATFEHHGEKKAVDILVKPFLRNHVDSETTFMITFLEKELNLDDVESVDNITLTTRTKEYVSNLEEELKQTKEELQTSLEEIETSNEELQAANEELLASNEELQSTNEELQSVNEEINTVNAENIQKMDDLAALNADINNLLESTQIGTIFLDGSLCIRKFTPAIKDHFSFLNSDMGRPISHFTGSIGRSNLLQRCKRVLKTGKTLEKAIVSKDGLHYLRRISPYIDSNEKIDGVVITFIEIESLQKSKEKLQASERRFKSFYEEDPVMHISVDPQSYKIVHCNKMTVKQLKYESKEELIGKSIYDLYNAESQVEALKSNKDFTEDGVLVNLEQNILTKTGEILPVILNATAEKDEDDNVVTIRYTFVEIEALKKAEDQLREQKADLERANRDLEQFVSICSHDLQEPLSTIKFGIDILGKIYAPKLDEKGQNYVSYIKQASTRLSEQIRALLEHSRIGREGVKKLVNTRELVDVVKYDLGKRIKDTRAKIHIGDLPRLEGYEVELRLLFQNLISNAIKYTPKDRDPEVRISAYREGDFWTFSVVDNGVGIAKEDQDKIFTIFNRVKKHDSNDGTGVGLAHVEKIVHLHNGSIWVDSQEGVGSTFYFKLKA